MFSAAGWRNVHRAAAKYGLVLCSVLYEACGLPAHSGPESVWWRLLCGAELWAKIIFGWMKLDCWPLMHLALLISATGWRQNATLFLCQVLRVAFKHVTYSHLTHANSLILPLVRRWMIRLFDDLYCIVKYSIINSPHWTHPPGAEPTSIL